MTNPQLFSHYNKRLNQCRRMLNSLPNSFHNPKWDIYVSNYRYYHYLIKQIDLSARNEMQSIERRTVGNYGNYFSDPDEMEKYKEKIMIREKYKDDLPDANNYPHDLYEVIDSYDWMGGMDYSEQEFRVTRFKRINVNSPNGIFKQWEADI